MPSLESLLPDQYFARLFVMREWISSRFHVNPCDQSSGSGLHHSPDLVEADLRLV